MSDLARAVEAVRAGGIVGVPTDTVYGLAVDPYRGDAVSRLFALKHRKPAKPIGLLVASLEQAERLGLFSLGARNLANQHWPGPLTLVVRALMALPDWVGDPVASTVGLRVPAHNLTRELLGLVGPLAVTSANRSGWPPACTEAEAEEIFGKEISVYLAGTCPGGESSTVVDVTGNEPRVLRAGPIAV